MTSALLRHVLSAAAMVGSTGVAPVAQQGSPDTACRITGRAVGAAVPLPGVAISVLNGSTVHTATSTATDGTYRLSLPAGSYRLRAELTGFEGIEREISIEAGAACEQAVDLAFTLTPRHAVPDDLAGRRTAAGARLQRLAPQDGNGRVKEAAPDDDAPAAALLLPSGFAAEDATGDAIAVNGAAARIDRGLLDERVAAIARGEIVLPRGAAPAFPGAPADPGGGPAPGAQGQGGPGGPVAAGPGRPGGPGGGGGAPGRGGPAAARGDGEGRGGLALGGRGAPKNRITTTAEYTFGGSALDTAPYQLRADVPVTDTPYTQQNFGATVGGRLRIPRMLSGTRTNFTVSYAGARGHTLFDRYATVPTAEMRAGDFSTSPLQLVDPLTGAPFAGNQIPVDAISPQALALLRFIPLPNLPGARRNYHYTTTTASTSDGINARLTHNFTENGRGAGPGGRRGGGRGVVGGRGTSASINAQIQFRRTDADQANTFSTLGGARQQTTFGLPVGVNIARGRSLHQANVNVSHSSSSTTNRFAGLEDVAGRAGIRGTTTDPSGWGVPSLSFSTITGLRDVTPSDRSERRVTTGYSWSHPMARHTLRAGGEARLDRTRSDTESNANGTFVFTGVYSSGLAVSTPGADVADFLLGLPQQASVQYGPGAVTLAGRSLALFLQDDWRARANLTLNLGLRYELLWPFVEQQGHLVNLDVTPGFTAAAPVFAGETGAYSGEFPAALLVTDTNNLAPRIGMAWRPSRRLVVRGGYGISFNAGAYAAIARQFASQPPFAATNTEIGTLTHALLLESALSAADPSETTNTYGADKDYALGRVQTWNVDFAYNPGTAWSAGAGYTHTRGASLDVVRAPNRGPDGLRIAGVQPFLWQSAEGSSRLHSAAFRLQRRQVRGLGGGVSYTLARSRDNAPSIGGGGGSAIVAQNDEDLGAEWALSSFDRRHRVNATLSYELPFGANRRWLNDGGPWAAMFENWRVNATMLADAGTPLTARVQGALRDVSAGVNGTLRADYNGGGSSAADPSVDQFFNTGAFSVPAAGLFGTSSRNVIIGPGTRQLNAQLSRDVRLGGTRTLTTQLRVNNLLNTLNYAAVDTSVNSPTFGQVLAVRPLRAAQLNLRFRF
jgi:trimeric autotransporter adhesin